MASKADMLDQVKLARQDNQEREDKVSRARGLIYEAGLAVNSERVEGILKDESLVPTHVCVSVSVS